MTWDAITAIASTISTLAFIMTAVYIRDQLRNQRKDQFLNVTNDLFTIWQSRDFMEMQLWLIHRLEEKTWSDFIAKHRCDYGEIAFHRVGSFYDRVGTLVQLGFVNDREILKTIGGYAIAVWNKIEPLVREARRIENSDLFTCFEKILPACRECYVPTLAENLPVRPFTIDEAEEPRIKPEDVKRRLDRGEPLTPLDVRHPAQLEEEPRILPGAIHIPPDQIEERYLELPENREIAVYCA